MTSQNPTPFGGFPTDNMELVRIPSAFFTRLLPIINDLNQLRLFLYMVWHVEQQESKVRYFQMDDLQSDPTLSQMMDGDQRLEDALSGLVNLGAVLKADLDWMNETYYFINSPQGRSAVEAIHTGQWQEPTQAYRSIQLGGEPPNIFKLYEENIGPITPMMADILKMDETEYPQEWIREAIQIAIKRNARNWKFVQAILERWQKEGRGNEQNRRDHSQDPNSYRESWLRRE